MSVNEGYSGNEKSKKLLGAVGLAARARKLISGSEMCVETMRVGKGKLLIIASDVSENTRSKLVKTALFHKIPYMLADIDKAQLSNAAGKLSDSAAIILMDEGFVKIIEKLGAEIYTTDTEVLD